MSQSTTLRRFTQHAVVRNALSLYGIQAANYVLPWITFPYLARVLGLSIFGKIGFAQAVVSYFLVITEYGFNFSVTREVSLMRDDMPALCRLYTSAMAARALLMFVSLALMSIAVFSIPRLRTDWPLFFIGFLTVAGSAFFPQWLFQGLEKMAYISIREVGARIIGLLTIFFLVRTAHDYLWAAAIMSGSSAIAGFIGLLYVRKLTGVHFTGTSVREIRRTLTEGWHIFLSTAAIKIYTSSNTVILGLIATDADVGAYTSVVRILDPVKSLVAPLSTAIYPHISRVASESRQAAVDFIRKHVFRLTAPFALISAGMLIGAPIAIPLLYGPGYSRCIELMQIMSPIPFIVALGTCYATYFMLGLGYKKQWSNMIVMAGGFNFVVLLPLLRFTAPSIAVAITGVAAEAFVLARSYQFFRQKAEIINA